MCVDSLNVMGMFFGGKKDPRVKITWDKMSI